MSDTKLTPTETIKILWGIKEWLTELTLALQECYHHQDFLTKEILKARSATVERPNFRHIQTARKFQERMDRIQGEVTYTREKLQDLESSTPKEKKYKYDAIK